jgi:hypothetical protein
MTAPAMVKTNISETVTAMRTFGNSLGSRISAMKEGSVIWPLLLEGGGIGVHKSICDIQHCAHSSDKGCSRLWPCACDDLVSRGWPSEWVILYTGENHPK